MSWGCAPRIPCFWPSAATCRRGGAGDFSRGCGTVAGGNSGNHRATELTARDTAPPTPCPLTMVSGPGGSLPPSTADAKETQVPGWRAFAP